MENAALQVQFDVTTGGFSVTDKRTGRLWEQAVPGERYAVRQSRAESTRIVAELSGPIDFRVEIAFAESNPEELVVTLSADPDARFPGDPPGPDESGRAGLSQSIAYPYPFVGDPAAGRHLYTRGPGMMLPITEEFEAIGGRMATSGGDPSVFFNWLGLVEGDAGMAFYAASFEDCHFRWNKLEATESRLAVFAPQACWLAEKGAWAYDRTLRYVFSATGGYVKLTKWARGRLRDDGLLVTLEEKARNNPAVESLRGAPIAWVWLEGRDDPKMIREMKEQGIDNVMLMIDPNHPPYPSDDFIEALEAAGYHLGIYQYYGRQFDVNHPAFLHALPLDGRVHYRDPGFERYMAVLPSGELWSLGGAAVPPGDRIPYFEPSAHFYEDYILNDVREIRNLYPMMKMFYSDGFAGQAPFEDFSAEHPHNRRFDIQKRGEAIEKVNAQNAVSGSFANVSSWYLRVGHWSHGGMTLNEVRGIDAPAGVFDDTDPKLDIAHWEKYVMKPYPPDARMVEYDFMPTVRVPLMELLAHDCIVNSTQWRDSCHRWGYAYWDYRDLWHILYGNIPMWHLSSNEWWRYYWRFAQCYENVLEWHKKIFGAEMTDHKFLTPDQMVQQTRFANGWAVTVNFSESSSYEDEGAVVAPMGFRTFQWQ